MALRFQNYEIIQDKNMSSGDVVIDRNNMTLTMTPYNHSRFLGEYTAMNGISRGDFLEIISSLNKIYVDDL